MTPDPAVAVVLPAVAVLAALLGAAAGWWGWTLAARDERTVLPLSWRPWLGATTGLAWGAGVLLTGSPWTWPAVFALGAGVVLLGAVDVRSRLLPNRLVLPFAVLTATTLAIAGVGMGEPLRLAWAVLGSLALFSLYLMLALASPGSLGMGDVKLAAVLGAYGGWLGWSGWWAMALAGFVLGGGTAVALLIIRRARLQDRFAFGPPMLVGALATVLHVA